MISFLRKLRKKGLAKGKIGTYLLYAFGEIILIVVGILIALWISTRQDQKIARDKEAFYLEGLKTEFEFNQKKLENLMAANRLVYTNSSILLERLEQDSLGMTETALSKLLYETFAISINYNPANAVLNEILNSGNLETLSNPELRAHLTGWDSKLESVRTQETGLSTLRLRIQNILTGKGSIRTILDQSGITENVLEIPPLKEHISNEPYLRDEAFKNELLIFAISSRISEETFYQPLLEEIKHTLEQIESQIPEIPK